jgi:hypothetical protein
MPNCEPQFEGRNLRLSLMLHNYWRHDPFEKFRTTATYLSADSKLGPFYIQRTNPPEMCRALVSFCRSEPQMGHGLAAKNTLETNQSLTPPRGL